MEDYYQILGVHRDADGQTIKKAYKKLALRYHPDRNPGDALAETQFKKVSEAYHILSNPTLKAQYDWLSSGQAAIWAEVSQPSSPQPTKRRRRPYKQGFPRVVPFKVNYFYFYFFLGMAAFFGLAVGAFFLLENQASKVFTKQAYQAYYQEQNYNTALSDLLMALEKNEENLLAHSLAAQIYRVEVRNYELALYHYSQAIIFSEKPQVEWYYGRAMSYRALGEDGLALLDLETAHRLAPSFRDAALELANLQLYKWNNLRESEPIYKDLLEQDSTDVPALVGLAAVWQEQRKYGESMALLQKAEAIAPSNVAVHYFMGFHYLLHEADTATACEMWEGIADSGQLDVQNELNKFCQ